MGKNSVVEVNKAAPGETRLAEAELEPLAEGQVRLRVDRFALTANNVTYAVMGEMLGYWGFFPTEDAEWGRVPAMGWADVAESNHPDVETGGRYYGWYPMARFVDLTVTPVADGLRDDGVHRQPHARVYRGYVRTTQDPMYPKGDDVGDAEDRHALLRGLFLTGLLADEFFADEEYFGAEKVVVLCASSKTAIGFAQRASERDLEVVGVTSPGNADFVRGLAWYDQVVTYDEVGELPTAPTVSVDMSGNGAALAALHERLADRLTYSMTIGKSHHDAPAAEISAGPIPQMFFAPSEVARRVEQWGRDEYQRRCADALEAFVAGSETWLDIERSSGSAAAAEAWHQVFAGEVAPSTGRIVTLHE